MTDAAAAEVVVESRFLVRAAWLAWLAIAVVTIAGLGLIVRSLGSPLPASYGFPGFTSLFAAAFGTVGAVVLARRPDNRVGVVLTAVGALAAVLTLATGYAYAGLIAAPGSLPFAEVAAWTMAWLWLPLVLLAGPVLLSIFPNGRMLRGPWPVAVWLAGISAVLAVALLALREGPLENFPALRNPFGLIPASATELVRPAVFLPMTGAIAIAAVSLVVRYRASDRDRQQQLKWIAVAALAFATLSPLGFTAGKLGQVIFIVGLCGIPVAAGLAILRYRLYDIDTIINRAIVYGLLTAILAGLYTASVGLMQRLSQAISASDSEAAIVLTTIVIVTTFTPIKNRLQRIVDVRFKENIDAAARLSAFVDDVRRSVAALDERRVLRRFLDEAVVACASPGGRLQVDVGDGSRWSLETGAAPANREPPTAVIHRAARTVSLTIARPQHSAALRQGDVVAVTDVLGKVLDELP